MIARGITASAIVLVLASVKPAGAGAVSIETVNHGNEIDIRASTCLKADAGTAWRVLTDYDHYTDFIPDLYLSRVLERHGEVVTVKQSGAAAVWLFKLPLDITFEINEAPPTLLLSRAVAGSLRGLTSRYTLRQAPRGTRLDYVGHVVAGFAVPGRAVQKVVKRIVARQFQALADEIEREGAVPGSDSTGAPSRLRPGEGEGEEGGDRRDPGSEGSRAQ